MTLTSTAVLGALILLGASAAPPPPGADLQAELTCVNMVGDGEAAAARKSPLDSMSFRLDGHPVKICYGRPSARGRTMLGGRLPYGQIWRTGANEPTMIHTPIALDVAGIRIGPGSYSLYTVPGESEWTLIVNRSISQWGHERYYTDEVRAMDVGRATVKSGATEEHVETLTFRAVPADSSSALLLLEWERTRVSIPVAVAR